MERNRQIQIQIQTDVDRPRQIQIDLDGWKSIFANSDANIHEDLGIEIDIDKDRLYRQSETDERVRQT